MKNIRILWLYSDLLDLYGDSGNIRILEYYLKKNEISYSIDHISIFDEADFKGYDFIYCGPGKLKNIIVANNHLKNHADKLKKAIEQDTLILFTGSSMMLLGKSFTDVNNNSYEAAGIFDYTMKDVNQITIKDVISSTTLFNEPVYGFINRTYEIVDTNYKEYLFTVNKGLKEANEGFICHNTLLTMQLGPLLAKNPAFLKYIFKKLTDIDLDMTDTLEEKAYKETIKELK